MPITPPQPPANMRTVIDDPQMGTPNSMPLAALNNNQLTAPSLMGADAIPFSVTLTGGTQTLTLGFPNITARAGNLNPINPTLGYGTGMTVPPNQIAIFFTLVQTMVPGVAIAVDGQGVDTNGTVHPGPFLGGSNYQKFQVVMTFPAGTGIVSGWIVGLLMLSAG